MKNLKLLISTFSYTQTSYTQTIESLIQQNDLKLSEVENFIKQNNLQILIDECVDFPNPDYDTINSNYSQSIQRSAQNETQYVFNVYFHIINENDGTREIPIGENEIMDAVALLNINYNPINIFFKYIGHSDINNSNWTTVTNSTAFQNLRTYAIDNDYYVNEAFNIFICEEFGSGAGIAFKPGTMSLIEDEDLLNSTLQHEIAHNFLIHHIHQPSNPCEHVNGTNSDTAGDLVIDTNAAHSLDVNGTDNIIGNADDEVVYSNGIYTYNNFNNRVDCINTPYTNVQILNYMASNSYLGIRESFTDGQGVRMRETIENNLTTIYANVQNSVASLYEPYSGVYRQCCWNQYAHEHPPLFQPGFDYEFVSCSDTDAISIGRPLPWGYDDLTFETGSVNYSLDKYETNYEKIKHLNHTAIRILQLDNQSQKCYSNLLKNATSGTVIKFEDEIINTNVTITQKDSLNINNNNLMNNLDNGLYIIKKNYEDGSSDQKTIYKNN